MSVEYIKYRLSQIECFNIKGDYQLIDANVTCPRLLLEIGSCVKILKSLDPSVHINSAGNIILKNVGINKTHIVIYGSNAY